MVAIAKNRRFAKIHLKIISSETDGPVGPKLLWGPIGPAFSEEIISK
jgi:hypothetical protein